MKLYIYNTEDGQLFDTVEADSYDGDAVHGDFGSRFLTTELELSSKEDLSETLRADWRQIRPTTEELLDILLGEVMRRG